MEIKICKNLEELANVIKEESFLVRNAIERALAELERSFAPMSSVNVGCSIILENGSIISGHNCECIAPTANVCAELNALQSNPEWKESRIKHLFLTARTGDKHIFFGPGGEDRVFIIYALLPQKLRDAVFTQPENISKDFFIKTWDRVVDSIKERYFISFGYQNSDFIAYTIEIWKYLLPKRPKRVESIESEVRKKLEKFKEIDKNFGNLCIEWGIKHEYSGIYITLKDDRNIIYISSPHFVSHIHTPSFANVVLNYNIRWENIEKIVFFTDSILYSMMGLYIDPTIFMSFKNYRLDLNELNFEVHILTPYGDFALIWDKFVDLFAFEFEEVEKRWEK